MFTVFLYDGESCEQNLLIRSSRSVMKIEGNNFEADDPGQVEICGRL